MKREDSKFLNDSKKLLDDSVNSLDAVTLSRLNQARQEALLSMSGKQVNAGLDNFRQRLFSSKKLLAAYSVVAIFSVTAWLAISTQQHEMSYEQLAYIDNDMEILVSDAELELLDELAFVSWLLEIEHDEIFNDAG